MQNFLKYHLYIFCFIAVTTAAILLNWDSPPNFDEAHAYNIARFLSPTEIFSISKTEGHPFLWYYLLMLIAKPHLFYPHALYALNLIIMLFALWLLCKNAPFPTFLKYFIILSAPFLQFYSSFARSYSLTILLLFTALSIFPQQQKKQLSYLSILLLLANTNIIGLLFAAPLGIILLISNIKQASKDIRPLLISINAALLELLLILLQFLGHDTNIPQYTPTFMPLKESLNLTFFPLNTWAFSILSAVALIIFIKQKHYAPAFFLLFVYAELAVLFAKIYQGTMQHHNFFYIALLSAFWINKTLPPKKNSNWQLLPLAVTAFLLIFNPNNQFKNKDRQYLQNLRDSAFQINQLYKEKSAEIIVFEQLDANIIHPYLDKNIELFDQKITNFKTPDAFSHFLYQFYMPIIPADIANKVKKSPQTLLYKACGENKYHNTLTDFTLKYSLNQTYCLYDITLSNN